MESKQFCPENVGPGLDVAWNAHFVGIIVVSSYLIAPLAYRIVSTAVVILPVY